MREIREPKEEKPGNERTTRENILQVIEKRTTIEAKPARIKQAQSYSFLGITQQPFNYEK